MGKAIITANLGDGLYRARPLFNLTRLNDELAKLNTDQAEYSATLTRAVLSLSLLEDETEVARRAMNAVINQWQQDLLNLGSPPEITPPTPDDPDTSLPWDPADKAQEGPLFDAINAARTGAGKATLTRDTDMDTAARRHVLDMSGSNLMGHIGSDKSVPSSRVAATGYQADLAVELVACGAFTASSAVNQWAINSSSPIFSDVATVCGVAYTYSTHHPATHLWVAVLAHPDPSPDPSPPTVTYPDDPAQKAAREQEAGLEKIEPPKTAIQIPDNLTELVKKFGIAAGKEADARREVTRLIAEADRRTARIAELTAAKAALEALQYDVWSTFYTEALTVGQEIETAEPPGWLRTDATAMTVDGNGLYAASYTYTERPWNIAAFSESQVKPGKLSPTLTAHPAATFWNAAMEAGQWKWKPLWKYGTITSLDKPANRCDLVLESPPARKYSFDQDTLPLNESETLTGVQITYPPCNGYGFEEGDEVLVLFEGQDRTKPKVVGFRRAPRDCNGREDWLQL
ncbi:MAG: CAP domain-containing protein [Candidatus Competibacteraceae bacterium]|nr:CAP domain-containing protein [Candidatus Competibacteraceae bacterium]